MGKPHMSKTVRGEFDDDRLLRLVNEMEALEKCMSAPTETLKMSIDLGLDGKTKTVVDTILRKSGQVEYELLIRALLRSTRVAIGQFAAQKRDVREKLSRQLPWTFTDSMI